MRRLLALSCLFMLPQVHAQSVGALGTGQAIVNLGTGRVIQLVPAAQGIPAYTLANVGEAVTLLDAKGQPIPPAGPVREGPATVADQAAATGGLPAARPDP